jgi:hypothetical protein
MLKPDFLVENHGSIFLFRPLNGTARRHLEERTSEDAQWFAGALAVEHRFARDLAQQLLDAGWGVQ